MWVVREEAGAQPLSHGFCPPLLAFAFQDGGSSYVSCARPLFYSTARHEISALPAKAVSPDPLFSEGLASETISNHR